MEWQTGSGGTVQLLRVRSPAVAGTFYPAEPAKLRQTLHQLFERSAIDDTAPDGGAPAVPKAIIAPHAGYQYSGQVAATAYRQLTAAAKRIQRVVLVGPAHRVAFRGLAVPASGLWQTPLGTVAIDRAGVSLLTRADGAGQAHSGQPWPVLCTDEPFAEEHCLEVQLPFLQSFLPGAAVLPILVGAVSWQTVGTVLDALWGGEETLIVISSDLSHYLDYDTASGRDQATSRAIQTLDIEGVGEGDACGRTPIQGLLAAARSRGLKARTLALCNSGDTAGPRSRVVGYGAYAFYDAPRPADSLPRRERRVLLGLAASAIRTGLEHSKPTPALTMALNTLPTRLREPGASFVSLHLDGTLRGCVGSLRAVRPLATDVAENARRAALHDPRFPPLPLDELERVNLSVSVLSTPKPLVCQSEADVLDQLRPGVDGLILEDGKHRATFLPAVWESLAKPEQFLRELKRKAGLPPDHWSATLRVWTYITETFE